MSIVSHLHQLLQRRNVSILHPYVAVERSAPPVSPVSEPQRRSVGHVPLPSPA